MHAVKTERDIMSLPVNRSVQRPVYIKVMQLFTHDSCCGDSLPY